MRAIFLLGALLSACGAGEDLPGASTSPTSPASTTSTSLVVESTTRPITSSAPEPVTAPAPATCEFDQSVRADLDGNGVLDVVSLQVRFDQRSLLVACFDGTERVEVLLRRTGALYLTVVDIEGDGADELFWATPGNRISPDVLRSDSLHIAKVVAGDLISSKWKFPAIFGCIDLDGDGLDELVQRLQISTLSDDDPLDMWGRARLDLQGDGELRMTDTAEFVFDRGEPPLEEIFGEYRCGVPEDLADWERFLPDDEICENGIGEFVGAGVKRTWYTAYENWPLIGFCVDGRVVDETPVFAEGTAFRLTDADVDGNAEVWMGGTAVSWGGVGGWTAIGDVIVPINLDSGQLWMWSGDQLADEQIDIEAGSDPGTTRIFGDWGCFDGALVQVETVWSRDGSTARWTRQSFTIDAETATLADTETGSFELTEESADGKYMEVANLTASLAPWCGEPPPSG